MFSSEVLRVLVVFLSAVLRPLGDQFIPRRVFAPFTARHVFGTYV